MSLVNKVFASSSGTPVDPEKFRLPNPFKAGLTLDQLIGDVVNIVLILLGLVAFGYLLYGGALFLTSQGDSEKVTNARNTILYAIIGIIVVVLSYSLFNFVIDIF